MVDFLILLENMAKIMGFFPQHANPTEQVIMKNVFKSVMNR